MTARRTHSLVRQLLGASRPVSWINTAFPFAAAYFLTAGHIDFTLLAGTLFFLVPYNLAMYGINDVFDYESDLANPRKGGIEGSVLERTTHRATLYAAVCTCVPFIAVLVIVGNPASWAVLCLSLFAVAAYSAPGLRFKELPFLDSITSSTHFVSPAVYGLVLAGAQFSSALLASLIAFFFWGIASHAFGAVQDVLPDRDGDIGSIATVMGARWTVRFAMACWAGAGALVMAADWPGPLAALLVLPYIATAFPYRSVTDQQSPRANRGWKRFIWLNYMVGFLATMLLIYYAAERM